MKQNQRYSTLIIIIMKMTIIMFSEGSCDTEDFSFPLITGVNYIYTCNPTATFFVTATFFLFLAALKSLLLTLGKKFNLIKYIV